MNKYHMELTAQGSETSAQQFSDDFDAIADAFFDCEGIENPDLAGDFPSRIFTFSMDVTAQDEVAAITLGMSAVRTALHVAGGSTPGWEQHFQMLRQTIETEAGAHARDLIDV